MTHALIKSEVLSLDTMIETKLQTFEKAFFRAEGRSLKVPLQPGEKDAKHSDPGRPPKTSLPPDVQHTENRPSPTTEHRRNSICRPIVDGTTTVNLTDEEIHPAVPGQPDLESKAYRELKVIGQFVQPGSITLNDQPNTRPNWWPVKIVLDTAGDLNLISRHVLDAMKFSGPFDTSKPERVKGFGGTIVKVDQHLAITWALDQAWNTLNSDFYVVDGEDFDILIGKHVIEEEHLLFEQRHLHRFMRLEGTEGKQATPALSQLQQKYSENLLTLCVVLKRRK